MDYANADGLILPDSKPALSATPRPRNKKIRSFITENESYTEAFNGQFSLNPKQLVLEALEILQKQKRDFLPLAARGKCVGMVYTKDLVYFLGCDDQLYGTLYHKFNFDLYTAIAILCRS